MSTPLPRAFSSSPAFGNGTGFVISIPASTQVGDLLLAFVAQGSNATITPPAGWSLVQTDSRSSNVYSRVAAVGDPGSSPFFSLSTAVNFWATVGAYASVATVNPIDTSIVGSGHTSTNVTIGSMTTTRPDGLEVEFAVAVSGGSTPTVTTYPATKRFDGGYSTVGVVLCDQPLGAVGGTPSRQFAFSGSFGPYAVGLVLAAGNTPPNAPAWTTADGQAVDVAADSLLDWDFSDPDAGDSQSQFVLDRWALDSGGARVGTAVRVTQSTPVTSYTIPGGSLTPGQYEFKVATRDAQGAPALDANLVFSTSLFQTFAAKPSAPTITAPANGATVAVTDTLTWSTPQQDAYQVQQLDGSGVLVPGTDTGEVGGDAGATTRSLTLSFPTNNVPRTLRVRRKYGGLWSEWATVTVNVSWTAPPDPTVSWTAVTADAAIDLAITNPAPGAGEPAVSYNDVYFAEPGEPEERKAMLVPPNSTWRHWLPNSDAVYTYRVVAVGVNGTTSETTAA